MGIICSGQTDIGRKRQTNQDAIYINRQKNIYLVADGMGGHNGGDVASQLAIESISQSMLANLDKDPNASLQGALKWANQTIFDRAKAQPELSGMGTTSVLLYFKGTHAFIGNVGDSRAYLINQQKLFQLTRDHSVIHEKLYHGLYTRQEAQADKQKNALARTVGFELDITSDIFSYKVARGDLFLLCSDGLHGMVSETNMLDIVNHFCPQPAKATQKQLDQTLKAMIALANHNGGKDNVSCILVIAQ